MSNDTPGFTPIEPAPEAGRTATAPMDPQSWAPPSAVPTTPWAAPVATPPRRTGRVIGIVAASLGGLAVITVAAVVGVSVLSGMVPSRGDDAAPDGPRPEPVAASPLDCDDPCFDDSHIGATILDGDLLDELGFTEVIDSWGDFYPSDPALEYEYARDFWDTEGGTPAECFFTSYTTPVTGSYEEEPGGDDLIEYTGSRGNESLYDYFGQSTRLFEDSTAALDHIAALAEDVAGCSNFRYSFTSEYGGGAVSAYTAGIDDKSIAAAGFKQSNFWGTSWLVDMQRGNLVVRTVLSSEDGVTDDQVVELMAEVAAQLAAIEP